MASTKTTTYNDTLISYTVHNPHLNTHPLIFIHGYTCSSALWRHNTALTSTHYSILIDLPGHGASAKPHIAYTMDYQARAVAHVLTTENITSAVLIGHSMGGPVSTMTLRLFPDLVAGIVYVDSFFELPESYLSLEERRGLARSYEDDAGFKKFLGMFWKEKTSEAVKEEVVETMMGTPKHVRVNACVTDVQPHMWADEEVYDVPALAVQAKGFLRIDGAWKRHVRGLEVSEWEGFGHFLFMEDPERFGRQVGEWLERNGFEQKG